MGFSIIIPLTMPPILPVDTGVVDLVHPAVVYRIRTVHLSGDDRLAEGAINASSYSLLCYQHVILSPESVDHHIIKVVRALP